MGYFLPARWGLLDFIRIVFLLFGYLSSSSSFYSSSSFSLDHVYINFNLYFRLANSSPSFLPTLFAKLFANIPAQYILGPQHGTCPAQYAPLDLNLAQLSMHHWTSTWDLPSSVYTAGPQPGTCPVLCPPLDLNGQIKYQKICQMECQIEYQKIWEIKCHEIYQIECQKICQIECHKIYQIKFQKIVQIIYQKIYHPRVLRHWAGWDFMGWGGPRGRH